MPFVEDLDEFLDITDFADEATYTPQGGTARPVKVLFDAEYVEPFGTESSGPAVQGKASDFSAARQGDALTVRGANYLVRTKQPDGQGWITLKLELQ